MSEAEKKVLETFDTIWDRTSLDKMILYYKGKIIKEEK